MGPQQSNWFPISEPIHNNKAIPKVDKLVSPNPFVKTIKVIFYLNCLQIYLQPNGFHAIAVNVTESDIHLELKAFYSKRYNLGMVKCVVEQNVATAVRNTEIDCRRFVAGQHSHYKVIPVWRIAVDLTAGDALLISHLWHVTGEADIWKRIKRCDVVRNVLQCSACVGLSAREDGCVHACV